MDNELRTNAKRLSPEEQFQIRKTIIRLSKQGKRPVEIAEILDVSKRHAESIIKKYREEGFAGIKQKRRGRRPGAKRVLSPEQERYISNAIIDRHPEQLKLKGCMWTRANISELINRTFFFQNGSNQSYNRRLGRFSGAVCSHYLIKIIFDINGIVCYNCSHFRRKGDIMVQKSNSYHLEIRTNQKTPYGLLRRSYREDGKVKKETLCHFPNLSLEQLQLIKASLQGKTVMKEEFKILSSREYGASFACISVLKELELHKAIHARTSLDWVKSAIAMIIGRIVFAGSKLALSKCGTYSALWEICGITDEIYVDTNCYDAMDKLFARQSQIQKSLAKKHLHNGTIVLYDITSCYMEDEYADSKLVEFGYNRDKKRGATQIVISLLCNKDGCPVAVEVLKGGTKDETTVLDKITEIGEKYDIEKVIFVGDRGMITQAKYEEINHDLVKVVSALSHGKIKELCDKGTIQLGLFDKHNIVEVINGKLRYMLCLNPHMAERERKTRQILLAKTTDELDRIISSTRKSKNSKAVRVGKVINKYKMAKFFKLVGSDDELTYRLDEAKVEKESRLDGCYVVFTDVSKEDLSAVDTVKTYKSLINAEQAFRSLKTTALEVRPVYHKTDVRIKCHVFICMLAYYIMWHMKQRLAPLVEIDGEGYDRKYSFDFIIESLKAIRSEDILFMDANTKIISAPNEEQALILKLLGVAV